MKVTETFIKQLQCESLIQGKRIEIPKCFQTSIDLLYQDNDCIIAFSSHRYLNDFRIYAKIMILLNQLERYYNCFVFLHCFSYRSFICHEGIYETYTRKPISNGLAKEN